MLRRFQESLESTGLIPPGARVLVGYSGGADSTCLLHLLARTGIEAVAAHLHHGQRAEAEEELQRCAAFAESLGLGFVSGRADVPRLAADLGCGLEEAGRKARYAFFESAKHNAGCHLVATAHTLDDHVETILLNLVRGAGLAGLRGIPRRRDDIVRPLAPFRRSETLAYCVEHGLWFHDDPANSDTQFSRARIRHRVVPELEAINPGFREAVNRLSHIASAEEDLLNGIAAASLERCETPLNGHLRFLTTDCELGLSKTALMAHPGPVVARAFRLAASALGAIFDHDSTEGLVSALEKEKGSWTGEGGGVVVEWAADLVHIRQIAPTEPYRFPLTTPGDTESIEFGWTIICRPSKPGSVRRDHHCLAVTLDSGAFKGPLHLRSHETGDKIGPLGLGGHKLVSDLFQHAKLTDAARRRLPLICDMVGPVWIPGICLADRVKMTDSSRSGLDFSFEPHSAHPPSM